MLITRVRDIAEAFFKRTSSVNRIDSSFVVHIGQAKCGSTALQQFLSVNQEALHRCGYNYPSTIDGAVNHRLLTLWLLDQWRPLKTGPRWATLPQISLSEEAAALSPLKHLQSQLKGDDYINILSSEGLFDLSPAFMGNYFSSKNTKIVLYVREQMEFLLSAYAQAVHSSKMSMEFSEFVESRNWMSDYASHIAKWEAVFGKGNVMPRVYDRQMLVEGDICNDFMQTLGIADTKSFTFPSFVKSNPTIGGPLLRFKLLLNSLTKWDNETLFLRTYRAMGALASQEKRFRSPPVIKAELARNIRQKCEVPNKQLFERYISDQDGFREKEYEQCDQNSKLSLKDFERICGFLNEFPNGNPENSSSQVVDAHYMAMKKLLV